MTTIETIKKSGFVVRQDDKNLFFKRGDAEVKVPKFRKVVQTCGWCQGTGIRNHFGHIDDGVCYTCKGKGKSTVKTPSSEQELEIAFMEYRSYGKLVHSSLRDSEELPEILKLFKQADESGLTSIYDLNK